MNELKRVVLVVTTDRRLATIVAEGAAIAGFDARSYPPERVLPAPPFRPDIVVMDLEAAHADRVAGAVKQALEPADIPVVGIVGFLAEPDMRTMHESGFATLLIRPVTAERLAEVITTFAVVRPRVLLVDDDTTLLRSTSMRLHLEGFEVVTSGPEDALDVAERVRPDIVVSDVLMPIVDGFTIAMRVSRHPQLGATPVILISANYVEPADRALAAQMGATAYIERRGLLAELVAELWRIVVERRRLRCVPDPDLVSEPHRRRLQDQIDRLLAQVVASERRNVLNEAALEILRRTATTLARGDDIDTAYKLLLGDLIAPSTLTLALLYVGPPGRLEFKAGGGESFIHHPNVPDPAICEAIVAEHGDIEVVFIPGTVIDMDQVFEFLAQAGVAHTLLCPLNLFKERMGLLLLGSDRQDLSGPQWKVFAQTVASQLALAIAVARRDTV